MRSAINNNNNNNNETNNSGKSLLVSLWILYICRTSSEFHTFAVFVTLSYHQHFMSGFEGCSYSYLHTKPYEYILSLFTACRLRSEWKFSYWNRVYTFMKNRQLWRTTENVVCGENSYFYLLFIFSFKASGADSVRCSLIGSWLSLPEV